MLGASLSEVWGEDFKPKKKIKRKKNKLQPLTPDEMDSELLITESDKNQFKTNEYDRRKLLRDDRFLEQNYKPVNHSNSNVVTSTYPHGSAPRTLEDDPDYMEFLEFKKMKYRDQSETIKDKKSIFKIDMNHQLNELLLYIFTGFFLLVLYDNIYRFGKKSY